MINLRRWAVLCALVLGAPAVAHAQDPYDTDDEEELARREWAQQQAQYAQPDAPQYGYVGYHPIPYDQGGGYCTIETGAHFHNYPPFDSNLFRERGGWFYFVGDPRDFSYSGQTWGYNGHHPIPAEYGGGYCYIGWGHYHGYPPPPGVVYNLAGGFYVYAGGWDPLYWQYRDRYTGYWGGYYRNTYYGGRYYVVRPPAVYRPSLVVGAPGVYRPGVTVRGPLGGHVTVTAPRPFHPGPHPGYAPGPRPGYAPAPGPRPGYAPAPGPRPGYAPAPGPRPGYAPAPGPHPGYAPAPHVAPPAPHAAPPAPVRRAAPPPPAHAAPPPPRHR